MSPSVAEEILAGGSADMVSMARPLLADAEFVNKAAAGRADEINTCIACNQACLDHVFQRKLVSCLVNPRACHELELRYEPAAAGSGSPSSAQARRGSPARPCSRSAGTRSTCSRVRASSAGSSTSRCACPARKNSAKRCATSPGASPSPACGCTSARRVTAQQLLEGNYDEVVVATGVVAARSADSRRRRTACDGQGALLPDVLLRRARGGAARGDHRRGRHRLRRGGVSRHRRALAVARPRRLAEGMGRHGSRRSAQRPRAAAGRAPGTPGLPAAAQVHAARPGSRQDHRLDPSRGAQDEARRDDRWRQLRRRGRARPAR